MSNIKIGDKVRYVFKNTTFGFTNLTYGKIYKVLDYRINSPNDIRISFKDDNGALETLAMVCIDVVWFEKVEELEEINFLDILKGY